jgi:hypothetical protein
MTIVTKNPYEISDPRYFAHSGTEHGHQVALFAWAAIQCGHHPELKLLFAIPNGGSRGDNKRSAMIQGATMKAEGVKPGVSDCMLPVSRHGMHGLWIEMKKPGGKESEEQIKWGAAMVEQGYWYQCCDHWLSAAKLIASYLSMDHAIVTELAAYEAIPA